MNTTFIMQVEIKFAEVLLVCNINLGVMYPKLRGLDIHLNLVPNKTTKLLHNLIERNPWCSKQSSTQAVGSF